MYGLGSNYNEEAGDLLHELHNLPDGKKYSIRNDKNESKIDSLFLLQDDNNDQVSFRGNKIMTTIAMLIVMMGAFGGIGTNLNGPQIQNQLLQWSTFRNADDKLTNTQMDGNEGEDSTVRHRPIQFDDAFQIQLHHSI